MFMNRMMKYLVVLFLFLFSIHAHSQCERWQNKVSYKMEIDFDTDRHQYTGDQFITYTNGSPDTLHTLYFHLFLNAFQPGSSMDMRSLTIRDPDRRVGARINQLKEDEIGYQKINAIFQDGEGLRFTIHETILEVGLDQPVLPGDAVTLRILYDAQVPLQIRRMGRMSDEGIHYSMAQWYPRLCQYDELGWHNNPYIGREFYGSFGEFDVSITIDTSYTLGGTGYLQNPEVIGKGYTDDPVGPYASEKLTWHFKADNVHDFMWGADPEYTHDTYLTRDSILLRFFYRKGENTEVWSSLPEIMSEAFDFIQQKFGPYPYRQYAFVQGGDGGMEYPMSTLITGHRSLPSLVGVSVHELMHSWYQGVLGINESLHPWMDEGFTTYATEIVMDELGRRGIVPGLAPKEKLFSSSYAGYYNMVEAGIQEPLTTHADHYDLNTVYGISSYSKGALYLYQLSYIIGQENLEKTLLSFYDRCKFHHPNPDDFRRTAEKVSGIKLKWYNEYWVNSIKVIDYAIDTIIALDDTTSRIVLSRDAEMPMPIDLGVELSDGSALYYTIPLNLMFGHKPLTEGDKTYQLMADWDWTYPKYIFDIPQPLSKIEKVIIDPSNRLIDIDRADNTYPLKDR